jgi:ATP-dependent DNA helicase DinG
MVVEDSEASAGKLEHGDRGTKSGDLAEMDGLDERSSVIPLVTSTRENCLGSECADFKQCHVVRARREAMAADVVVVNHHLFFADMALRDTGVAELLPSVEVAVFDEAHQLPEAGVQFLGTTLGSAQALAYLAAGLLARPAGPGPAARARAGEVAGARRRGGEGGARTAPGGCGALARLARHAQAALG